MFHIFGDSHSMYGWKNIRSDKIQIHHKGPILCYSFGQRKLRRINIAKGSGVKNGDYVCFSLGEIDCRCHIHKHVTPTNTYQKIIDSIVENYFIALEENSKLFQNIYICVYSVVPAVQKDNTPENPDYPYLGTDEERKSYVEYFNKCLKKECIKHTYIFIDVSKKYADENGFLNKKLSDKSVHIQNPMHLLDFFKRINYDYQYE